MDIYCKNKLQILKRSLLSEHQTKAEKAKKQFRNSYRQWWNKIPLWIVKFYVVKFSSKWIDVADPAHFVF